MKNPIELTIDPLELTMAAPVFPADRRDRKVVIVWADAQPHPMSQAWKNARAAAAWHGVGKPREYLGGSIRMAYAGQTMARFLIAKIAPVALLALSVGYCVGSIAAQL